jgi:hypothetical protein
MQICYKGPHLSVAFPFFASLSLFLLLLPHRIQTRSPPALPRIRPPVTYPVPPSPCVRRRQGASTSTPELRLPCPSVRGLLRTPCAAGLPLPTPIRPPAAQLYFRARPQCAAAVALNPARLLFTQSIWARAGDAHVLLPLFSRRRSAAYLRALPSSARVLAEGDGWRTPRAKFQAPVAVIGGVTHPAPVAEELGLGGGSGGRTSVSIARICPDSGETSGRRTRVTSGERRVGRSSAGGVPSCRRDPR